MDQEQWQKHHKVLVSTWEKNSFLGASVLGMCVSIIQAWGFLVSNLCKGIVSCLLKWKMRNNFFFHQQILRFCLIIPSASK